MSWLRDLYWWCTCYWCGKHFYFYISYSIYSSSHSSDQSFFLNSQFSVIFNGMAAMLCWVWMNLYFVFDNIQCSFLCVFVRLITQRQRFSSPSTPTLAYGRSRRTTVSLTSWAAGTWPRWCSRSVGARWRWRAAAAWTEHVGWRYMWAAAGPQTGTHWQMHQSPAKSSTDPVTL